MPDRHRYVPNDSSAKSYCVTSKSREVCLRVDSRNVLSSDNGRLVVNFRLFSGKTLGWAFTGVNTGRRSFLNQSIIHPCIGDSAAEHHFYWCIITYHHGTGQIEQMN